MKVSALESSARVTRECARPGRVYIIKRSLKKRREKEKERKKKKKKKKENELAHVLREREMQILYNKRAATRKKYEMREERSAYING